MKVFLYQLSLIKLLICCAFFQVNAQRKIERCLKDESFSNYEQMVNMNHRQFDYFVHQQDVNTFSEFEVINNQLDRLSVLVHFSNYCQKNNIKYQSSFVLQQVNKLYTPLEPYERIRIEDEVIKNLNHNDIPSLEYYGMLYGNYGQNDIPFFAAFDHSMERVINGVYEANWNKVIRNDNQLSFYIYKCYLFNTASYHPEHWMYNRFENNSTDLRDRIFLMLDTEEDNRMRQAMMIAMYKIEESLPSHKRLSVRIHTKRLLDEDFIAIKYNNLIIDKDYQHWDAILDSTMLDSLNGLTNTIKIMESQPHPIMTPYLVELLEDRRMIKTVLGVQTFDGISTPIVQEKTVALTAAEILDQIFDRNAFYIINENEWDKISFWQTQWENRRSQIHNWKTFFIETQIAMLEKDENIPFYQYQKAYLYPLLNDQQRERIMKLSLKVNPEEYIQAIQLINNNHIPDQFIENAIGKIELPQEALALLNIVAMEDKQKAFEWAEVLKLKMKSVDQYLFTFSGTPWYMTSLKEKKSIEELEKIRLSLLAYVDKNDLTISEQHQSLINLLPAKSEALIHHTIQLIEKTEFQNDATFLLYLTENDQKQLLKKWNSIQFKADWEKRYLMTERLGIAIPNFSTESIKELHDLIDTMSFTDLKLHYLKKVGLDVEGSEVGEISIEKVTSIIDRYNTIEGFVSVDEFESQQLLAPLYHLFDNRNKSVSYRQWLAEIKSNDDI